MTDRSEPGDAPALIYLEQAEDILHSHVHASLITDEAALLRGCLFALVAIGRHLVDHTPDVHAIPCKAGACPSSIRAECTCRREETP